MRPRVLTKEEWPSYQLALRCLKWTHGRGEKRKWSIEEIRDLAREIRAYRDEENKTN